MDFKEWYYKMMIEVPELSEALNYAKALGIGAVECIKLREEAK